MSDLSFTTLALPPSCHENLERLGYLEMTPVQAASLPHVLAGKDLIVQAKTGSGKTAAYALGLLNALDATRFDPQALVVCPSRELAEQVAQEIRKLARYLPNVKVLTLTGGAPSRPQRESLAHGAHVIVGTPGRLMDHIEQGSLDFSALRTLVLDEADRMIDMGFYEDVAWLASQLPRQRQTLLFSATYPENIQKLAARFLKQPIEVRLGAQHDQQKIEQFFFEVQDKERSQAVIRLLAHYRPASAIAFCNTRARCQALADLLQANGVSALALHGDLEQRERDDVLIQFSNQSCAVLVATDVAARGLDIDALDAVINVDVTQDTEQHIHRIGRTGRSDHTGLALSLCSPDEMRWALAVERYQDQPLVWKSLDSLTGRTDHLRDAPMVTLCIHGGKKNKLRKLDILGALTGDGGMSGDAIGKIHVADFISFVAIDKKQAKAVFKRISQTPIKGKVYRMRYMQEL